MPTKISQYAKSLTYIALAVAGVLVTALTDNVVTHAELINVAIIGVGAVGVYFIPNLPSGPARVAKTVVAFAAAGLVALNSLWTGGVTTAEWLQIAIAAFAGVGVYIIPNEEVVVIPDSPDVDEEDEVLVIEGV